MIRVSGPQKGAQSLTTVTHIPDHLQRHRMPIRTHTNHLNVALVDFCSNRINLRHHFKQYLNDLIANQLVLTWAAGRVIDHFLITLICHHLKLIMMVRHWKRLCASVQQATWMDAAI